MNRLKLMGAALLLVIFDTYTASAEPGIAVPPGVPVESAVNAGDAPLVIPAADMVVITAQP